MSASRNPEGDAQAPRAAATPAGASGSPGPAPSSVCSSFGPTASLEALERRADILWTVRRFFRERGVLEVETPILCNAGAIDEHLEPIRASVRASPSFSSAEGSRAPLWLVTSPEHSMKRLLAAGFGPIFQITRAFRDGERGRLHNPEFAILEWYRPGWDHHALMDEVEDLVRAVLSGVGVPPELAAEVAGRFERLTYREAFLRAAGTDPFAASERELEAAARERAGLAGPPHGDQTVAVPAPGHPERMDRDSLLNVLLAALVERTLGFGRPTFLLDYPPSQAALARVRQRGPGDPPVAERFELHVRGVELANGYHELTDPEEQERRFRAASEARRAAGKVELPLDERFLEALRSGLPACAGVALGLDRLVMLAVGAQRIDDVIAFPSERA